MKPLLIAVVGGSASGKTTLARELARALEPNANLLSQDSFYLDAAHLSPARRERLNFDHPRRIDWPLLSSVLDEALQGRAVSIPRYSFEAHARETATDHLSPKRFLIAEGLWLLTRRDIRSRCAFGIYIVCPSSVRLRRRLARDTTERGRTQSQVLQQWRDHIEPGFYRFVAPQLFLAHEVLRFPVAASKIADLARRIQTLAEPQP